MRGGANFIVVSPDVATILESMNGFSANPGKDALTFAAGVTNIGSISNRYDVYKNPYMTENVILLGFKGSTLTCCVGVPIAAPVSIINVSLIISSN